MSLVNQAQHLVLDPQFFLLESVKKHIVWLGPLLFGVDLGLKSSMLGCERVDVCIFHRVIPFAG